MSLSTDYLIDRRRLRRKLGFWRTATIVAVAGAFILLGSRYDGDGVTGGKLMPHIAKLSLEGVIAGDHETIELVKNIGESSQAKAVLLTINSPGGTTEGAEKLFDELRRLSAKKPVVAVVGTLAASGGYIAALAADEIVARGNSLVGSIGVLFQYPNVAKTLDILGVKVEEVKSSPLKAAPNGFEPTSEAARAALASVVDDSFVWFKGLVKERRKLTDAELAAVSDGRIFTARQGVPLKLVDLIGGEREAVEWLEANKGVAKKLPIREWKKQRSFERLGLLDEASAVARLAGFSTLASLLERAALGSGKGGLDGLVAIWQGPGPD
jgi:protease-4